VGNGGSKRSSKVVVVNCSGCGDRRRIRKRDGDVDEEGKTK